MEKNDVIGENNVKLCDFIETSISRSRRVRLEPLFLGYGHKWMVS